MSQNGTFFVPNVTKSDISDPEAMRSYFKGGEWEMSQNVTFLVPNVIKSNISGPEAMGSFNVAGK